MAISIYVKITGGPQTPVEVVATPGRWGQQLVMLASEEIVTAEQIAEWIKHELTDVLEMVQDGCPVEGDFDGI